MLTIIAAQADYAWMVFRRALFNDVPYYAFHLVVPTRSLLYRLLIAELVILCYMRQVFPLLIFPHFIVRYILPTYDPKQVTV